MESGIMGHCIDSRFPDLPFDFHNDACDCLLFLHHCSDLFVFLLLQKHVFASAAAAWGCDCEKHQAAEQQDFSKYDKTVLLLHTRTLHLTLSILQSSLSIVCEDLRISCSEDRIFLAEMRSTEGKKKICTSLLRVQIFPLFNLLFFHRAGSHILMQLKEVRSR